MQCGGGKPAPARHRLHRHLYLHKEDHDTPLAETVRALGDLMQQGKIRYFGVSNYRAWRVAEICDLCDQMGIDRPIVSQPYYHALYRVAEVEHLPACAYYGLGVVSYSPLARGVLTGKYQPGADAAEGHARRPRRQAHDADRMRTRDACGRAEGQGYAEKRGVAPNHFAVAWVLNNRLITGVVAGPRTEAQWDDYLTALDLKFTTEDEAFIDDLVVTGHRGGARLQRSGLSDRGPAGAHIMSTVDDTRSRAVLGAGRGMVGPARQDGGAAQVQSDAARLHPRRGVQALRPQRKAARQPEGLLRILDIGCGGGIVEPLARLGAPVRRRRPGGGISRPPGCTPEQGGLAIDYRVTTAEALADAGERFDIVLAMEVVEHVADVKLFVPRAPRWSSPAG